MDHWAEGEEVTQHLSHRAVPEEEWAKLPKKPDRLGSRMVCWIERDTGGFLPCSGHFLAQGYMWYRINLIRRVSICLTTLVREDPGGLSPSLHVECEMFGSGCKHCHFHKFRAILSQFELVKLEAVVETQPLISVWDKTCSPVLPAGWDAGRTKQLQILNNVSQHYEQLLLWVNVESLPRMPFTNKI